MKVRFAFLLAALFAFTSNFVSAADPRVEEFIVKARAAVGSEQALNAVNSVRFIGTIETTERVPDPADATKTIERPARYAIDIAFQKPYRQRIILRSDKMIDTTGLDDYDGWMRRAEAGNEKHFNLRLMSPAEIKRLRANTWENLSFYRGIEKRGGRVEYKGEVEADGKTCVVLAFVHADDIVFTRYFDKATGRIVKTVTENGSVLREEGEIVVNGIRYPRKLINQAPSGQVNTISLDTIKVNEPVPASEFAVPPLTPPTP